MAAGAGHVHQHDGPTTLWRLAFSAAIFGLNFVVQGLAGLWTGSLGLVSDSLENLNDLVVNLLAIGAISFANKREPCDRYAYGWHRLEVFHTLLGVGLLMALAGGILWEAWHRLQHPVPIQIGWTIAFSALGLLLNLAATFVLQPPKGSHLKSDLNLRSAYLHALGDSLDNVAVIAAMVAIRYTGWRWIDPVVAILIVLVILRGAFLLLRSAAAILMHRAAFDHEAAKSDLMKLPGVLGVEDLRSWKICSHLTVATAHVLVEAERLDETERYLKDIQQMLSEHYGVRHLTVHFETSTMAERHHHKFIHRHEAAGIEDPGHHHGPRHGHRH
jgi:cobalt-zinc-cadmium efflux system protein